MSKKHFILIASYLLASKPMGTDRYPQWEQDTLAVASACARCNPAFDRARFLRAAGVSA